MEGYLLYRRTPSRLGLVVMSYWMGVLLLNAVPIIGSILASLLTPALSVGVMNACRQADAGQAVEPSLIFSGFRDNRRTLILMGGLYLLCTLGALGLSVAFDGGLLLGILTGQQEVTPEVLRDASLGIAAIAVLLTMVPVLMAYWYAPMLSAWYGMPLFKALFFSLVACHRNWRAFLGYGLALFTYGAFLPLLAMLLSHLFPDAAGLLATLMILPMLMIFAPVVSASIYVSYRDVFAVSENA